MKIGLSCIRGDLTQLNSSLDSEDLYGDVKEALTPAIVASHNIDAENSGAWRTITLGALA